MYLYIQLYNKNASYIRSAFHFRVNRQISQTSSKEIFVRVVDNKINKS